MSFQPKTSYNPNSVYTNMTPPHGAACRKCGAAGLVFISGGGLHAHGEEQCKLCSGTGRNQIPNGEVISGLRRGSIIHPKAQIWNGKI